MPAVWRDCTAAADAPRPRSPALITYLACQRPRRDHPRAIARGDELWSAHVVRAEVLAGMRASEEAPTRDLLRLITWVDVDESLSEAAGALGRRFLRSHPGIEVTDLILAALTQHLDAELKTTNVKHFPMLKGLKAPY